MNGISSSGLLFCTGAVHINILHVVFLAVPFGPLRIMPRVTRLNVNLDDNLRGPILWDLFLQCAEDLLDSQAFSVGILFCLHNHVACALFSKPSKEYLDLALLPCI